MKYGVLSTISYVIAMILMVVYAVTDDVYFGVVALISMILSTENAIISAIEKTKEGR